jgi:serine-type D-Ala-D-Ala carboxypeptidase (penicillin-binding protein 5/6)
LPAELTCCVDWSLMRRVFRLAAPALAAASLFVAAPAGAFASPAHRAAPMVPPTGIVGAAGELVNATSGTRMWSRGMYTEHPIASLTKVMTAMVVLADGNLGRKIRVTAAAEAYAVAHYAGSADLHVGDVLTARQLLEGMLLSSGADAAYLLANAYGPGWHAFVRQMNATARKLGMTQTHFANFDGLPWPTPGATYSSPRDLLIMGAAAMKRPNFVAMVGQRTYSIPATAEHHHYSWANTDLLLSRYPGAVGIKTGFTTAAGYCLLFEARRGGTDLMGVVLDSTNTNANMRFTTAAHLLNWGFANG